MYINTLTRKHALCTPLRSIPSTFDCRTSPFVCAPSKTYTMEFAQATHSCVLIDLTRTRSRWHTTHYFHHSKVMHSIYYELEETKEELLANPAKAITDAFAETNQHLFTMSCEENLQATKIMLQYSPASHCRPILPPSLPFLKSLPPCPFDPPMLTQGKF